MGENSNKNTPKQSWSDGLKAEFNKIIWPKKEDLIKETGAVVVATAVLGVIITIVDSIVQYGINFFIK